MNLKSLIWLHKLPPNAKARRNALESGNFRSLGISEMVKLLMENPGCDLDGDVAHMPGSDYLPFYITTAVAATETGVQEILARLSDYIMNGDTAARQNSLNTARLKKYGLG